MSAALVVGIVLVIFLVLMLIETPVAFALALAGGAGLIMLGSFDQATATVSAAPYHAVASYTFAVVPLYILLGMFAVHGKLAERVYGVGAAALRFLPGGLGIATIAACTGFAAVAGSSVATAASIGKLSVKEMRRNGYSAGFASGIVAMGGTLGVLIPPSLMMVFYGILSRESIAMLSAAGIIPGLVSALAYSAYIASASRRLITPVGQTLEDALDVAAGNSSVTRRSRFPKGGLRALLWLAVIFVAILMGMFTGFVTLTESAAIGAFVALIMLIFENVREGLKGIWRYFAEAAKETGAVSSMAFTLVIGASVFSVFLVKSRIPYTISSFVSELDVPPILIVILILIVLIPLGMFLDELSVMIIVVPLVHPVVLDLGFNGIWFGVLFVILMQVGMVAPPVGMNCFVISSVTKIPLATVYRGVIPFIIPAFAVVALIIVFPDIALWLPSVVVNK